MNKKQSAIILGIICLLLTVAIFIQIKTIDKAIDNVGIKINDNNELRNQVLKWKSEYEKMYATMEKREIRLEEVRQFSAINNEEDIIAEQGIKDGNKILGLTEVSGSGVVIKIDDNRTVNIKETLKDPIVHEGDVLQIISELYNAGADAISINGERIVGNTGVLCDGNVIRIGGEISGVPLTIKAIGYPERLYYALTRPGGYLEILESNDIIVEINKSDSIVIPKYKGTYTHSYIN